MFYKAIKARNSWRWRVLGAGLCAALLVPCAATAAQEDPLDADPVLETVVVTAARRETRARDVAAAVSRVDGGRIRREAPDVPAEALRGTPGAFFQQTTPGQGTPIVRGLKGSQVLHLVDGIRLNNAFFRDAPNQYLGLVDALTLDRVEVLRGAAGGLYGADAMGGVVQLLTREHRFENETTTSEGRLYASYDSADRGFLGRAEAASGNLRGSLAGGVGWQDRGDRRTADGTVGPSGFESRAGDLKLLLGDPETGEWMFAVQSLEQPDTPRVDELVPGFGQAQPASAEYAFAPNRRSLFHGRYRTAPALPWLDTLSLQLARQVITDDRVTRDFGSPARQTEQNESTLDGAVFQATSRASGTLALSWGAEVYRDSVRSARQRTDLDTDMREEVRPRFPDGSSMDSEAAYLSAEWRPTPPLALDAGLRYSRFRIRLPETSTSPAVDLDPDDLTGDLRLRFALAPGVALVSNLGRGFRPPNIFDLGTLGPRPGNRFNIANPALGPESVWSLDLGLKAWGEHWTLEAFAFRLDYEDRITSVATGATTPDGRVVVRSENRNEVLVEGVEASGSWRFTEDLEASFVLNWTRGEDRDDTGVTVPADRIPPLNGRLALGWVPRPGWRVRSFLDFAARQDRLSPRDVADPRIDPTGTDGWATINLHVQWAARDNVDLGLRLENLLDEAYREHGSGLDAPGFNVGLWADLRF